MTLAPVVDPESLRKRIAFGEVTRIDKRTVYVKVDWYRGTIAVVWVRAKQYVRDLFSNNA